MVNKDQIRNLSLIITLILIIIGALVAFWLYGVFFNLKKVTDSDPVTTTINYTDLEKIGSTPSYGAKVSPDESGFGRVNPFSPYKEPPVAEIAPATPNEIPTTQ